MLLRLSADGDWDSSIKRSLRSGKAFPANKADYAEAKEGRKHAMWVFVPDSVADGLARGCPEALQRALRADGPGSKDAIDSMRADLELGDGNALSGAIPLVKVQYGSYADQDAERPGSQHQLYFVFVIFDGVAAGGADSPKGERR